MLLLLTISSLTTLVPLCSAVVTTHPHQLSDLPGLPLDHSPVVARFFGSSNPNGGYSSYRGARGPGHYHRHHRRHVQHLSNHRQAAAGALKQNAAYVGYFHFEQPPRDVISTDLDSSLRSSSELRHPPHNPNSAPDSSESHQKTESLVVDHLNGLDERNVKSGKRVRMVHHPTYDEIKVEFYGPHTPFISISSLENLLAEEGQEQLKGAHSTNQHRSNGVHKLFVDGHEIRNQLAGSRDKSLTDPESRRAGRKNRAAGAGDNDGGSQDYGTNFGRVPSVRMYSGGGGRGINIPSAGIGGTPLVVTFNQNYTEWPGPGTFEAPNGQTGVKVANFGFYEHKPGDVDPQSNYTFEIQHDSDRHHDFFIGKKDGTLRVNKRLDRERQAKYLLKIGARDEAGNTGWAQMQILVLDVNDNAPSVHSEPAVCNVTENKDPGQVICKVFATDPDSAENGPPFMLQVPSNSTMKNDFRLLFDQSMDGGNGGMTVTALKRFDREDKKQYDVPIYVKDSGNPPQSAIRYLRIVISDVNDNPMSDGSKSIHVYSYKGKLGRAIIGSVYVTDADDHDHDDKTYAWVGGKPDNFDLDTTNGTLWIEPSTPEDTYNLQVKVTDFVRKETGVGSVAIVVTKIEEEAFLNSGSIRIRGISAEEFITERNGVSKYEQMKTLLQNYLGLKSADSVQIFSIMPHAGSEPAIVDVRFAAHESPYKQATLLNGKIDENRSDFATKLGIEILQVGVDECFSEWCEGGCTSVAQAFTDAQTINAGELALVGVKTTVTAQCTCPTADIPNGCAKTACKNGGLCHKTDTKPNFFCECRGSNLKGAQCEGISRSFTGNSYVWLDPIASCKDSHISLEFIAADGLRNAVIMYNGVMDRNAMKYSNRSEKFTVMEHEWVWVGIVNGKLAVDLNLGSGPGSVILDGGPSVNDNQWHRVDILRSAQYFDVILDQCRNAPDVSTNVPDYTKCRGSNNTQGVEKYLNLNSVLQVGGISSKANQLPPLTFGVTSGFNGCIRNLKVDEQLYDLENPPLSVESTSGCAQTESLCGAGSASTQCSGHGSCLGKSAFINRRCVCDPGWQGSDCETRAQWKKFNYMSYIQYRIAEPDKTLNTKAADIKILFSPSTASGTLSYSSNSDRGEFISVEMDAWSPLFRVNNGGTSTSTGTEQVPPKDTTTFPGLKLNQTYWIQAQKWPGYMSMTLDMLPGVYTTELTSENNEPSMIHYDQDSFFLGGLNQKPNNGYEDFEGCIADYRIDDYGLPLDTSENVNYASITAQAAVTNDCALPNCTTKGISYCIPPMVCMDFWKGPFCTCPDGAIPQFDDNYALLTCTLSQGSVSIGITTNAVVAILVSLLVLILLVLILVIWMKRRTDHEHDRFRPDDDIREGIVTYNEEGGGEEDQDQYDIKTLRKPVLPYDGFDGPMSRDSTSDVGRLPTRAPGEGDIGDFIGDRMADADRDPAAPPYDELRVWADEGDGLSSAGSLSSLASDASNDLDWDNQLNSWGPRFGRLADMYGGQEE